MVSARLIGVTEDELWDRIEAAIQDIVHIVNDTSIPMRNSDIAEKVQRSLRRMRQWIPTSSSG